MITNGQTTTYPKAKLAEIKKRGGKQLAVDILSDIKWDSGTMVSRNQAKSAAKYTVAFWKTRALYQFLKDNNYFFNVARAIWQAAEIPE